LCKENVLGYTVTFESEEPDSRISEVAFSFQQFKPQQHSVNQHGESGKKQQRIA